MCLRETHVGDVGLDGLSRPLQQRFGQVICLFIQILVWTQKMVVTRGQRSTKQTKREKKQGRMFLLFHNDEQPEVRYLTSTAVCVERLQNTF